MENIWYASLRFNKEKNDIAYFLKEPHKITTFNRNVIHTIAKVFKGPDLKQTIYKTTINKPYLKENTSKYLTVSMWSYKMDWRIIAKLKDFLSAELKRLNIDTPKSLEHVLKP